MDERELAKDVIAHIMERLLDYPEIRNNFNIEKHLEKVIAEAYGIVLAKKGMTPLELKEGFRVHARRLEKSLKEKTNDAILDCVGVFNLHIQELLKDEVGV